MLTYFTRTSDLLHPPPKSVVEVTPAVVVSEPEGEAHDAFKMSEDEERELAELMDD